MFVFDRATCQCIVKRDTRIFFGFAACEVYMTLETDSTYPAYDYRMQTVKVSDDDPCSDAIGREYELRRMYSPPLPNKDTQNLATFSLYPVIGTLASDNIYWIAGYERETACPSRSYWQWSEEECAKVNTANAYLPEYPGIAHIALTNFQNASKWHIGYQQISNCPGSPILPSGSFYYYMYCEPYLPSPSCSGKKLVTVNDITTNITGDAALAVGLGNPSEIANCVFHLKAYSWASGASWPSGKRICKN